MLIASLILAVCSILFWQLSRLFNHGFMGNGFIMVWCWIVSGLTALGGIVTLIVGLITLLV